MNENELMQKLLHSKKVMDKSSNMQRGQIRENSPAMLTSDFEIPQAKYNIPQEFLSEQQSSAPLLGSLPVENTKPVGVPTVEAIKKSKLPDDIKRLMIEHPIAQAQQPQVTISNELVEKAARLMKTDTNNYIPESAKNTKKSTPMTSNIDYNVIKQMIEEAVENTLRNNGLLVENVEKTGELFSFRVGKHVFEGKVTKIKKLS